ncbi:LytR C-terminal domain-containing protein [Gordonia aquimaris]|uniref:LytR C-terminal domain-containing protein n=1 Tax=Gordonia aquimaris TaxID=2984863 RepID=A0A9X3I4S8_9ACTN|nr:LytR C-terminal domain-containing protein [Gordonia aquimaris]MCX2963779.1 LytR C-terminal domain-containing protein [Gordonia aquimaris]
MNADHEPSRLPLRAGAMMLLAVAIVFLGLGWHSAATSGDDPEQELEAAQSQATSATTQSSASAATSSSATASADTPQLCVFNAGSISGLAADITESLQAAGFQTDEPGNLSTASITENTIFYDTGQQSAAEEVADALGGDASVDPRPSSFTQCPDGMPVIVVTR